MQRGSLTSKARLEGPDVWEFRWSEKDANGRRVYTNAVSADKRSANQRQIELLLA